jgi:hypothetical protein
MIIFSDNTPDFRPFHLSMALPEATRRTRKVEDAARFAISGGPQVNFRFYDLARCGYPSG